MQKSLFPGYTIGVDAYDDIKNVCPAYGKKAAVIGGKHALAVTFARSSALAWISASLVGRPMERLNLYRVSLSAYCLSMVSITRIP